MFIRTVSIITDKYLDFKKKTKKTLINLDKMTKI